MAARKLNLVTFAPTGHTLAVLSRAADPEGITDVKVAVPDGLRVVASAPQKPNAAPVRAPSVLVPSQYLGIKTVDYAQDVVLAPSSDAGVGELLQSAWKGPVTLTVNTTSVSLALANPVSGSAPIEFWVLFEEASTADPARRMARGSIAVGATTGSAGIMQSIAPPPSEEQPSPMSLDPGTYNVVAFLATFGFLPEQVTV